MQALTKPLCRHYLNLYVQVKRSALQFTIKHYAAHVTYDAMGFCFKNRHYLNPLCTN